MKAWKAIYKEILLGTTLLNAEMDIIYIDVHQYILSMQMEKYLYPASTVKHTTVHTSVLGISYVADIATVLHVLHKRIQDPVKNL